MKTSVSVIIPTYNRASVIKRAIDSVLLQDPLPQEIIVVDDASTDNTFDVIEGLRKGGLPLDLKYFLREKNGGASAARNMGISVASGDFLAFLDSDDEFLPGKLAAQLQVFGRLDPSTGFVFTNYWESGRKKRTRIRPNIRSGYVEVGRVFPASIFCNTLSCWMVRKACLEKVGFFDEQIWVMEDLDMFARLVRIAPAYFIAEPFVDKHEHFCKKGDTPSKYAERTAERILSKWFPEMRRDRNAMFKFYAVRAKDRARAGDQEKAYSFFWKAWQAMPWRIDMLCKMLRFSYRLLFQLPVRGVDWEPLVSIIIPTYNRASLLPRAVQSVLSQTYQNIEIVIVDDGSTDHTDELVKNFFGPRVRYLRREHNGGVCAARNLGIRESRGEFIALLDSDDVYFPDKIRKSVDLFRCSSSQLGAVGSNFWREAEGKRHLGVSARTPWLPFGVYARGVFEQIGLFDEELEFCEDLDFGTRFVCSSFSWKMINEPLAVYYSTPNSLSSAFQTKRSIEIKEGILRKCRGASAGKCKSTSQQIIARIYYFLGKDYSHIGRVQEARECFLQAFWLYPLKFDYLGKYLKGVLGR